MPSFLYQYTGNMGRVTPCSFRNGNNPSFPRCSDGSCPGEIDGHCRFLGGGYTSHPEDDYEEWFRVVPV